MKVYYQQGISLIEVMVTVLILSTGLLAIAALQTRSLQYNSSAYLRSQANIIAYDVFDRMRIASSPTGAIVQPAIGDLASALPGGTGNIECNAQRQCTVTITWTEPTATAAGDALEQTSFSYTSRI